jgi:plastocyanin
MGNPSTYTSCGNIPRNPNTITVELQEESDSGQTGVALLTPRDNGTEVWLSLTEGDMESSAVHIHNGRCGPALGGVAHPLTNVVDGTSGTLLVDVPLDSLLTGEFAINSHNAQDSSIYTACGDIPAIDVSVIATSFDYDLGELVVPAGQTITMRLSNEGVNPHNMFFHSFDELNADDEPGDRLQPGQSWTRQLTFDRPGIYTFFCPVGDGSHENRGQIGVLRVVGPDDGEPTLEMEAPSDLRELAGPQILFGATVTNFNIAPEGEDAGSLRITLNGNVLGSHTSVVGAVGNIPPGEHTITGELLTPQGNPLAPPVQSSRTFRVEEAPMPPGAPALGDSPIAERRTVIIE